MNFSIDLPIGCQKVFMHPNLHGKKVLVGLNKGPSRNKWFRHRLQICLFSGLVIGWWYGQNFGPHIHTKLKVEYPPGFSLSTQKPLTDTETEYNKTNINAVGIKQGQKKQLLSTNETIAATATSSRDNDIMFFLDNLINGKSDSQILSKDLITFNMHST